MRGWVTGRAITYIPQVGLIWVHEVLKGSVGALIGRWALMRGWWMLVGDARERGQRWLVGGAFIHHHHHHHYH